jgi:hypothetical protein
MHPPAWISSRADHTWREAALVREAQELVRSAGFDSRSEVFTQCLAARLRAVGLGENDRALARWLLMARRACVTETLEGD